MKNFPLPLHHTGGNHRAIFLDEAQERWLRRYYPVTETPRLGEAMGVHYKTVTKLARTLGLVKSEKGMAAIRKRQQAKARRTNHKNGCYDRKRGHPCSEATMEGNRRRWQEEKEGLRENAMLRIKREQPERYAEWMERKSRDRKELIRKERLRVMYGLERKTKLRAVVMNPFTESQRHHRWSALKRGYLLDTDCSEGQSGRYTIYYDDDTERSLAFEANCIADGFRIMRDCG